MGLTMAEKILARAAGRESIRAGEHVVARPDFVMSFEAAAGVYLRMIQAGVDQVWDRDRIVLILDHYSPAPTVRSAGIQKLVREFAEKFSITHFLAERAGICHQVMPEQGFVAPGRLVLGTDSHTTTYGAFGCAGTGIGYAEMAYVFYTGELWFLVPPTIRFNLQGLPGRYVTGKDIILHIAGKHSAEAAQYKSVEFLGDGASALSLSSRMTMANMAVEIGAKFGFFVPDEKVYTFLDGRARGDYQPVFPDADANYETVHDVDLAGLSPQIARPPRVDDVIPLHSAGAVPIDQAFIGSCTNGRLEDMRAAAGVLTGRKIHRKVRTIITPASYEVYREAIKEGLIECFIDAGCVITPPGCGACFGAHMGVLAPGETCVSTSNRNFTGRMGSPEAKIYLSNPYVAAASAVSGFLCSPDDL